MTDKLIITKPVDSGDRSGQVVRVSKKVYALLEDLASKSGRSRSYIANKMIEFAYDLVQIEEEEEPDEDA
jgi:predicted transcriptional regulator